ncbi:MAG: tRNA (guanosine(37)-N1)-methyltransferase TrmD [Acidobacteria bacterium]|nr:tRNA (guanosine(37)-N1)-methyltransferase TrmD [Acidobacteriota bacterium]MCB9398460.1 tRNA (guanosine(37)-N1)-methyltransferase TrmD [Acidobacteriota bacterium]
MRISCLSLFPEIIQGALSHSIPGKAQERELFQLEHVQIRDFALDKHRSVDEIPYGGGAGMVLKPEPVVAAIRSVKQPDSLVIHPSPSGIPFTQTLAKQLANQPHLILIASRYEGLDQRVIDGWVDLEVSLGDFVISGGELACAVMIDAISRLIPGVVGKLESIQEESFEDGLLEHPQYTRPPEFEGRSIPEVLLSGHHEHIRKWRRKERIRRTRARRPDLFARFQPDKEALKLLKELDQEDA